ncbi:MAG: hypothetical protein AB1767_05400 [Bacillota bacterium]
MQLELMWNLQELDCSIAALTEEIEALPLHQEISETQEELDRQKTALAREEELLKEKRKQLNGLDLTIQKLSGDRETLRRKLYGGEVANVRELEQMEKKLSLLDKEQKTREDEALELMELIEENEQMLNNLSRQSGEQEQAVTEKQKRLEMEIERLRGNLSRLQEQRAALEAKLEPQFLERYRIITQRHHGRGVALVDGDICGGCSVFISSKQRGLLYNPLAMVYCETCGRLLVKPAQAE